MKLDKIQPSQLYISKDKLASVMKNFEALEPKQMEPIPVKKLGEDIIFTDGHTRAFAAYLRGFSDVMVCWEDEKLDWDEYEICVKWCKDEGIRTVADLKNRVVSWSKYTVLWLQRCKKMQKKLRSKKGQGNKSASF